MKQTNLKKVMVTKVVNLAVETSKMPNQNCWYFFGRSKTKYDLTSNDYAKMADLIKRR